MEPNSVHSSNILTHSSQKRKSPPESNSSHDEDFQLLRNDSSQLLRQLKSKNEELEARIDSMYTEFKTMVSQNQQLKSQVQNIQQQYEQVSLNNRELELRIKRFEDRSNHTETVNQDVQQQIYKPEQDSEEMKPSDPNIDQLAKEFEERIDLVESNSQVLIERLDSCQQNFAKMSVKSDTFQNQLVNLQHRLNNFEIHDTNMQHTETISTQQLSDENTNQNLSTTVETKLTDDINTSKEQLDNDKDGCDLVEKALCRPCENQISLSTDEIQFGIFDVCDKYNVILMKEKDKLKLFDHRKQIDERPWGELGRNNFGTCIHWCSFLDSFLILYRFKLYTLSLKLNKETSQMGFDDLNHIGPIRVYSLKHDTTNLTNNAVELLRFITTSPNRPGYMYLNRGYRRIELVNTNSWMSQRGWSKHDLDYGERDEIRSIKFSHDGTYLAMNIKWNERVEFIDLRKHDDQLTLMKTIRMPNDSVSLSHRTQISFSQNKWLVIDENNQCYKVSANPDDQRIIPIRTEHVRAIENVRIRLCFVPNHSYILVGQVIVNNKRKQGVFSFYKLPT